MSQFTAFLKKEVSGEMRSGRMLLFVILFSLFGIMNPAITKLTPWMLGLLSDQLAESGMIVENVTVDAMTSWTQFYKNMPIMLLIFLVLFSSSFAAEYQRHTLVLVVTKGMKRWKVLLAKGVVMMGFWTVGCAVSTGITYAYNAWFWTNPNVADLLWAVTAFWILGIWLITLLCVSSVCCNTAVSALLGVGGGFAFCYILSFIPKIKEALPIHLLDGVPLLAGSVDIKDYFAAIAVTLLVGIVNLAAAVFIFNKRDL